MKLMILDGNSIVNRAFYGVRFLSTHDGQPTNAVYGFLNILEKLMADEAPDALCVAFDLKAPTFRHRAFAAYKANRKPMPDDLASQMPILKEALADMRVPIYQLEGWEADDILGTAGRICQAEGWTCVIVTGDRDALQLVQDRVHVRLVTTKSAGGAESPNYTPDVFQAEYGFAPKGLIDLKALMGDSSDNYPGVPGVGEKTAKDLMAQFGSLDGVYAHLDDPAMKPAARKKLEAGRDSAYLSYDLATIRTDVPIDFVPEENKLQPWDKPALLSLFQKLEFGRLIDRYRLFEPTAEAVAAEAVEAVACLTVPDEAALAPLWDGWREGAAVCTAPDLTCTVVARGTEVWEVSQDVLGLLGYEAFLQKLFSGAYPLTVHDAKPLLLALLERGLPAKGIVFDTALAAYLLDPARSSYPLETVAQGYLGAAVPAAGETPNAATARALAVWRLGERLPEKLRELGMDRLYRDIDLPLCLVLAEMELLGIRVDRDALTAFESMLSSRISDCEALIYGYAGGPFNINSTRQLGELLFDKLGLPAGKKTKTGYSTNIDVLERLRDKHPVVPAVIDYRMLTKLHSTYAEGLLKVIAPDGRIHTTFQNMVTATGRLSSTDPNLQNIPIRTDLGGEIRKMFVPRPGCVLVDADYSQIELRVLSHIAGDKTMQQAFLDGEDIHTVTAAAAYGVEPKDVTPRMRRSAKAVNFGIVYGISEFSLAQDIGVSRSEAKAFIETYLTHYSGVRAYMKNIVQEARAQGYVTTLFGRRRNLPELKSANFNVRSGAERMALNTPIQGTAADIIKLAMLRVRDRLQAEGLAARLVLQVHDELLVETPEAETEAVLALVAEEMEHAAALAVPLIAEAHAGKSWYDAK